MSLQALFAPKTHPKFKTVKHTPFFRPGEHSAESLERYCLLHAVEQRPGSFLGRLNFSVRYTVSELRGTSKLPNFRIYAYFPIRNAGKVLSCARPTTQTLHHIMTPVVSCSSGRFRGMLFASEVFLRRLIGELGTPKLSTFCLREQPCVGLYSQCLSTARRIWTEQGSKRVIQSKDVPSPGISDVFLNFPDLQVLSHPPTFQDPRHCSLLPTWC